MLVNALRRFLRALRRVTDGTEAFLILTLFILFGQNYFDDKPSPSPAPTSEVPNESLPDSSSAQPSEVPFEQLLTAFPRTFPDLHQTFTHPNVRIQSQNLLLSSLKQRLPRKRFSKKQRVHKEHVSKQRRKYTKGESYVQGNPLFDELHEDSVEHMETNDAQDEGRTREMVDEEKEIEKDMLSTDDVLSADKEKVSTDRTKVSTDDSKVSTDRQKVSSDEQEQGTEGHSQVTQTPAAEIFKDDETIAKVLLNMSQAKAVSREKEKGVELREVEDAERPRPTSQRSLSYIKTSSKEWS
ncbi:hypothetical protein Tco_0936080 [Tanacetum coccineum]